MILVIEGLQYFTEFESKKESEIKFWLPRSFPKNIRVIITADRKSKSYANILKRNCLVLDVDRNTFTNSDILSTLRNKSFFMPIDYVEKIMADLKEMGEDLELDRTTVKTFACIFCPYETLNILTKDQVDLTKIEEILRSIDFYDK